MRMLGMSMHALGKGGGGCMHLYDVRAIGVELRVAGGSQAEVALRRNARMRATGTGAGRLVDAYSTAPVTARSSVLAPCGGSRMSGMCSQPWAWQFVYGLYMRLDALLWRIYHGQARQAAACGESAACCWRDENGVIGVADNKVPSVVPLQPSGTVLPVLHAPTMVPATCAPVQLSALPWCPAEGVAHSGVDCRLWS